MIVAQVVSAALHSLGWSVLAGIIALAALLWSYGRRGSTVWVRTLAGGLKAAGFAVLGLCLVDPIVTRTRPRPGSNLFLIVADNSKSLQLSDRGSPQTRGAAMRERLEEQAPWLARLGQDFEIRRYVFDTSPRPVTTFAEMTFDGEGSAIESSLSALGDRFRGQPVAGILLLTDGNATDLKQGLSDWKRLPPVYPVAVGNERGLVDLSVSRVTVTQTNFEAAPVTVAASLEGRSFSGRPVVVRVLDETGKEVERRTVTDLVDGEPSVQRFLLRPERSEVSFYTVQVSLKGEEELAEGSGKSEEATLANNRRIATVDRGGGPYRILYVSGRPNWEFKFLRRAIEEDDEVKLVWLVRIARREPKFTFLGQPGERTNPLFRGFGNQQDEEAEQYDQPVLIRPQTEIQDELRDGFPKSTADLYRYHAVILDDVEAGFFSQDQLSLLQHFVSRRGGGFLMLGGNESFVEGKYQRTPIGEMLPVYLDRPANDEIAGSYSLVLTREGWLQPWVRLRTNEEDEQQRLAAMPEFRSLNHAGAIKPGASVLARVTSPDGTSLPALAAQQFGRGRAAALLIGDLWRWNLRRPDHQQSDLEKSWRQTVRWLISDVPARVEVETRRLPGAALSATQVVVRARDAQFEPLENASVGLHVKIPDGREIELAADSSEQTPGQYEATFAPRESGIYRAVVTVIAADGSEVGRRETGWVVEPQTEEFRALSVNRPLLEQIARETGGEVVDANRLEAFVSGLPNRKIPIIEHWTYPWWHQWPVFLAAVTCLVSEWALRPLERTALNTFLLLACACLVAEAEPRASVLVVVGAEGDAEYGRQFQQWAARWKKAAQCGDADFSQIGLDKPGETNDRQRLEKWLAQNAGRSTEPVWLILIGHGTFDGKTARFNLRGPDVSAADLAGWLRPVERPMAIVNCASSSGPFLNELSAPERIVITATKSGTEFNFARFGDYLSAAISDARADLDKDEQVSLLEAFLQASSGVREFYARDGRLETEHPLIDDNGDRLGTRADWFRGTRAVKTPRDGARLDGPRANQMHLIRGPREQQLSAGVRERRDQLELDLARLRERKGDLSEDEYFKLLEPILVNLARLYDE